MRVLFSTGHPAHTALPPLLADEQVNCGPDLVDACARDGRVAALATPAGNCDLAAVAAQLPSDQKPEVVACFIDPNRRHLPRKLGAFKCPRVAIVAGTHAGRSPLIELLRYLGEEPFDRIVLLDGRHHAPFLHAAGYRNLHWFPGLTFPHSDVAVLAARRAQRKLQLAWADEPSGAAPRCARLQAALTARRLPFIHRTLRPSAALDFFGSSSVGLHASENGELGLRVFEILAAGAALLTDRLAPESGFEQIFLEGREVAAYGSAAELANLARDFIARPDEARALGDAGARWFDEILAEKWRREAFRSLAFDGVSLPEFAFSAAEKTRVFFGGDTERLVQSLTVYEGVQELHRTQETVRIALDREAPGEIVEIFSTLPRVALGRLNDGAAADLAVFGAAQTDTAAVANAARRWCYDRNDGPDAPRPAVASSDDPASLVQRARQREDGNQLAAAETLLREAAAQPGGAVALGDFLKRRGRLAEAMAWHRRALGCDQPGLSRATGRRPRVLFVVQHGSAWPGMASVFEAFEADGAWETIVVAMPWEHPDITDHGLRDSVFDFLRRKNIPYVRWDEFPLGPGCAEVVFLPDSCEAARPAGWRTENLLRLGVRPACCPHGFETAGGADGREHFGHAPLERLGWAIFAWSDAHKAMFRRHGPVGDAHVIVTGHPKTDALRRLDAARDPLLERFVAGRNAVCWAPHCDLQPDGSPFGRGRSTFARWKDFLPAEFARRRDLAFIIRPHPLFFAKLESSGALSADELKAFLARCAAADNIHLDRRASCLPAFAASVALLSDLSSLVTEFPFTGRALLYLRNPLGPAAEPHAFAGDFCATAETEADIVRFLDDVAAGREAARSAPRRVAHRRLLHLPAEGAGAAIKHAVERRMLDEERAAPPAKVVAAA